MTTRTTLASLGYKKGFSQTPFSYDFENLLSWDHPFTTPITPPDLTTVTDEILYANAEAIAQDVIDRVEATLPMGAPGFDNYIEKHYLKIENDHAQKINELYAKKVFLTRLHSKIIGRAALETELPTGIHIYAPDDLTPAQSFKHVVQTHGYIDSDFLIIEQFLDTLLVAITAAQKEIILKRCMKKLLKALERNNQESTIALLEQSQQLPQSKTITLRLSPTIQLGTTQGAIAIDRHITFELLNAWERLSETALSVAFRVSRLGIGAAFYSRELGNADLYHDSALSVPAELLTPELPENIHELAATQGVIDSPFRIHAEVDTYILTRYPKTANGTHQIPVRALIFDEASNSYVSIPSRNFPIRLTFPIHSSGDSSSTSPGLTIDPNPYEGVNLDTVRRATTPFPALELQDPKDCIYCFPAESGLSPLYIVFNSPYPGATTIGTYSGRPYNPDKAGGPVERLDWREATFTRTGVDLVKLHTSRFEPSDANNIMIDRLEKILHGESQATDTDKRFYTHEIRELERFRALGLPDRIRPEDGGEAWNNTHAATLEDYQLTSALELLYTPEAIEADDQQTARENK
ncbi:S-type pyocin domain-containing protein [Pseudomonas putida]|uniref:S-type pyocin domain-containing protein n=1 Tax=Pseudomonas putida TaxID=303 RepID=UPI0013747503|nr:S-type pyocin domain-containing protein [Pseudomonas putida]